MRKYIAKRILLIVPTLFAVSLITFYLSSIAPGDPVGMILQNEDDNYSGKIKTENNYREVRHRLGLDLPLFYFSFSTLANNDYLHTISNKTERETLARLIDKYGNRKEISAYYQSLKTLEQAVYRTPNEKDFIQAKQGLQGLIESFDEEAIKYHFQQLQIIRGNFALNFLEDKLRETEKNYEQVLQTKTIWKNYVPTIHYYGFNNQYHHWITQFLKGDFGISYHDKRPVASVIWQAMKITLLISIISIILTYLTAIPLGAFSATNKHNAKDKMISTFLFVLFSIPNFWIATLLIIFLGGGDYLNWFPSYGLSDLSSSASALEKILNNIHHLILPLICWTYPAIAFLSFQMRGGMLNVLNQEYIKTARAKGLPESKVIWKHSFRNSLLPVITLFARVFPLAISGSVILENIFSIPGMGKLAFNALLARDYPIIFSTMMISAMLTVIGFLFSDILYAFVDPRIRYKKKSN